MREVNLPKYRFIALFDRKVGESSEDRLGYLWAQLPFVASQDQLYELQPPLLISSSGRRSSGRKDAVAW